MDLNLNNSRAAQYHSNSQKIRVLTEGWIGENMYCPRCGYLHIRHFPNNSPVADFFCQNCGNQFELKSGRGGIGRKVADGAYDTMIDRITSNQNPDFFFMGYAFPSLEVVDLIVVPKFFFSPKIIEKRKPLSSTARRAGWVGCNILLEQIPEQGRIPIISNGVPASPQKVVSRVNAIRGLETNDLGARGWLFDILNCVNKLPSQEFSLDDVYRFEDHLLEKYPENHHIRPKIRQQLQVLRDKGVIEFLGKGQYRKLL